MYSRYPNYRFGGIKIPENYSGSAFAEPPPREAVREAATDVEPSAESIDRIAETDTAVSSTPTLPPKRERAASPLGFRFDLGRIFSGGIGFEELLILAVILLVSQQEGQKDLIFLLLILLFVG